MTDGERFASASHDHTLKIWAVRTGELVARFVFDIGIKCCSAAANLTFALPVSFAAVRRRILNVVNAGSGEKAWVKTLPLV
jgi:WD40 repeat protein